ncbi:hypothetical protein [Bacillus sp. es.036]|uniref:hypothetical protein n=1 Tax=Bacillus sp. es.036 TaxID=1761764 RepID=UPI000C002647|nr:hypothetical protein [Bacillus sp. es.036]PFG15053.1 hypothetical protein ATG70_3299 [Bacillus sp. es.036]
MMEYIAIFCGMTGMFLMINLFFAFLYLISKIAGSWFYRWASHDELGLLVILSFPLLGLTQYAASRCYEKFNWFIARMLLILYAMLLFILAILFFILFDLL